MKFEKPFSSFNLSYNYLSKPLEERWRIALHDPAYLIIFGGALIVLIIMWIDIFVNHTQDAIDALNLLPI